MNLRWYNECTVEHTYHIAEENRCKGLVWPYFKWGQPQKVAQDSCEALTSQKNANVVAWQFRVLKVQASLAYPREPSINEQCHTDGPVPSLTTNIGQYRNHEQKDALQGITRYYLKVRRQPSLTENCVEHRSKKDQELQRKWVRTCCVVTGHLIEYSTASWLIVTSSLSVLNWGRLSSAYLFIIEISAAHNNVKRQQNSHTIE